MSKYEYLLSSPHYGSSGTDSDTITREPPPLIEKDRPKNSKTKHHSHVPSSSATRSRAGDRVRTKSVSAVPSSTLVKWLHAQESTTQETRTLLNAALSQLDATTARAAKAEAQMRARETSAMLSHTQLTESAARAEEAAARARREAEEYRLQLMARDEEVRKERDQAKVEKQMRAEAEKEAERARQLARKWREESKIMKAIEDGRKAGYGEGLKRGRAVIAAAVAARESYDQRLVGDGTAYIEEYDDESDNHPRRRDQSRSRASRSRRSEPMSRHTSTAMHRDPHSRRERAVPSVAPRRSEPMAQQPDLPFPVPQHQPPLPPSEPLQTQEPQPQAVTVRRARSIQTDPSLFQSEQTRSQATPSITSPPRSRASPPQERGPSPPIVYVHPSPSVGHTHPLFSSNSNGDDPISPEQQSNPSESFSPQMPEPQPEPIPIPTPISQVPFAPGILPGSIQPQTNQYATYEPQEPVSQPSYFPMPAPPISIILVPPPSSVDDERDVQTPSTMTMGSQDNSLNGFDFLRGFPAPASRAGSAASGSSSGPGGRLAGGFDPDLSTIHEHSREGTAFGGGEDDLGGTSVLSPERERNVDQWRRSLGETYSPGRPTNDSDLLRPPSTNSTSRQRYNRPAPLNLDSESTLDRQPSSAGSTSSRSININIEPPSHPTSPSHRDRNSRSYSDHPQDDAFLSPHHAPLTLSADPDDDPVVPRINEEDDYEDDDDDDYLTDPRDLSEPTFNPIPIVDSLPPGFVPTPNGTRIIQLRRDGMGPTAGAGSVTGGVPIAFYHNENNRQSQGYSYGTRRSDDYDGRSRASSSRSSSSSGSGSSSVTELDRPTAYARSGRRNRSRGSLTSTFPPYVISDSAHGSSSGSGRATPYASANTIGGIYTMPHTKKSSLKNRMPLGVAGGSSSQSHYRTIPEPAVPEYDVSRYPQSMPEPSVPQYDTARYPQGMPEPTVPQYDTARYPQSMPEPAVPQYNTARYPQSVGEPTAPQYDATRYHQSMPEPAVPQYDTARYPQSSGTNPATAAAVGQYESQRYDSPGASMPVPKVPQYVSEKRSGRSLRRMNGSISSAIPPSAPYAPNYAPSYLTQSYQTPDAAGASRMTPAAIPMPNPQFAPPPGEISTMTAPAMSMPSPSTGPTGIAFNHPTTETSRMTDPVLPMPSPSSGPAIAGGASRLTEPSFQMPSPSSRSAVVGGTSRLTEPSFQIPSPSSRPAVVGGTSRLTEPSLHMPSLSSRPVVASGTSRLTEPSVQMPSPSSRPVGFAGDQTSRMTNGVFQMPSPSTRPAQLNPPTPAGGMSRMTAPVLPMPNPSMPGSYETQTPGGSRVTPSLVSMPEPTVPQYGSQGHPTPGGGSSRMTPGGSLSMPEPTVPQYGSQGHLTPGGGMSMPEPNVGGGSRMTAGALSMPEPSVSGVESRGHPTPGGGNSRMIPGSVSMPEPNVSGVGPQGHPTPGGGNSRMIPGAVSMPEPNVPQYGSQGHPTPGGGSSRMTPGSVTMPEPNVPQYGSQGHPTPRGGMSMPEPNVPGGSMGTPGPLSMPEPTVPQFGSQTPRVGGGMAMPEPTIPHDNTGGGGSRMTAPMVQIPEPTIPQITNSSQKVTKAMKKKMKKKGVTMPEPEIPDFDETPMPMAGGSSMVRPMASMPEPEIPQFDSHSTPNSRFVPPAMNMPIPSITTTPTMSTLPMPSNSDNGWGIGTSEAWIVGTGTPNMNRRVSLHAGTTPVTFPEPLPVPGPSIASIRRNRAGFVDSPTGSVDSTTRRNTEANKGPGRNARARGMASPWGATMTMD